MSDTSKPPQFAMTAELINTAAEKARAGMQTIACPVCRKPGVVNTPGAVLAVAPLSRTYWLHAGCVEGFGEWWRQQPTSEADA